MNVYICCSKLLLVLLVLFPAGSSLYPGDLIRVSDQIAGFLLGGLDPAAQIEALQVESLDVGFFLAKNNLYLVPFPHDQLDFLAQIGLLSLLVF
jgi:hypothetical protein